MHWSIFQEKSNLERSDPIIMYYSKVFMQVVPPSWYLSYTSSSKELMYFMLLYLSQEVQTQMVVVHLAKQFKQMTKGILDETPEWVGLSTYLIQLHVCLPE